MTRDRENPTHITRKCPDCGNTDNLIVLPGSGVTFYYCPKCSGKKAGRKKDSEVTTNN